MTTTSTTPRRRPVAGTVALWVLQVLLAGVFVMAALPKVTGDPIAVAGFDLLGLGIPGMIVVGWLELAGAVALLVPRLCGLAAACQIVLMIGATTVTAVLFPAMVAFPAVTLVLVCVVAWFRRHDTAALLRSVRR
ncbi:DoxX family protein [Pseudonocardia parietis]|uniref:Membrane protein YphA (DoxX/SURF4 family) n=1 Tax=Pseudonocardia parietis TaxID=570936 RepID=A0ABS4VXJ6_9PSEU|nr:DoxX family protein [Pseudonocardia parietis]MBP2368642.1 putative membrane protein YphA (DoxX/SURF4 family) [Pseudonocardia parietis]